MAYRDEQEALLARLEATEERLRVAENELADARRQLEEESAALQPSAPPPSLGRVGYPPVTAARTRGELSVLGGVLGTILCFVGVALLMWNLPGDETLRDIAATFFIAVVFAFLPGAGLLYFAALRAGHRKTARWLATENEPSQTRVAPRARVEISEVPVAEEEDAAEDDEEPAKSEAG